MLKIKDFSCFKLSDDVLIMLINVKIVSMINSMLSSVEQEKKLYNLGAKKCHVTVTDQLHTG